MDTRPPILAVIGASARAAAQSIRRAGLSIVAADRFADADLIASGILHGVQRVDLFRDQLVAWLAASPAAAWIYVGPLENRPELVDELAAVKPLWGNAGDVLRRVRSPERLAATVRNAGWRFPEFIRSPAGLPIDGTWLMKRDCSGGGFGVSAWRGDACSAVDEPYYWQRRLEGPSCSALFVSKDSKAMLLGATMQLAGESWCGAAEFHYGGSVAPLEIDAHRAHELSRLGETLVRDFQLQGLFGVDFVQAGDKWYVLEVNPRYTAAIEAWEHCTGCSAIAAHAAVFESDVNPDSVRDSALFHSHSRLRAGDRAVVGKAIVYAREAAAIDAETAAAWFAAASDWRFLEANSRERLADVPPVGTHIPAGGPVLTILVRGASVDEVRARLNCRAAAVYNQLSQCVSPTIVEPHRFLG